MAEHDKAPGAATPFAQHELYQAATEDLAAGRESEAAEKLRRLIALYPADQALRDMLVRIELKASLANTGRVRPTFARPAPLLRGLLLILFALALTLMVLALFVWAVDQIEKPTPTPGVAQALQECQGMEDVGDLGAARDCWQGLVNQDPSNSEAAAGLARIALKQDLQSLCREAIGYRDNGELPRALDLFTQIGDQVQNLPERDRGFFDCNWPDQIVLIERRMQLQALWQEGQDCFGVDDLPCGIDRLKSIRELDPTYRASEVSDLLYQAYVKRADPLLKTNGDCGALAEAVEYLDGALAEKPGDQRLFNERQLAYRYVQGCDAAGRGDWPAAVEWWQRVYDDQRDYAGGVLKSKLLEAYPLACEMLVEGSNGELGSAIACLNNALEMIPGGDTLEQERYLATEYMAGAEAFSREFWSVAIQRWGPIYAIRPDYLNGLLAANLRQACTEDPEPDLELCPP